ncbi:winged helix-turn-helix domain-containing protein [Fibrella sp. WM1]|uniref:winged helix-turn-helix domain-containing protein n=1 Tax=Fibrella musci TaxID=3242485 RepID=UPI003521DE78
MSLHVNGRIWLETDDERFMGIGRIELLEHIQRTGSINQAAKAMSMSYKRAWELVNSMNRQATQPLVDTQTGGTHGGGAVVTPTGLTYLAHYKALHQRFRDFLEQEAAQLPVL